MFQDQELVPLRMGAYAHRGALSTCSRLCFSIKPCLSSHSQGRTKGARETLPAQCRYNRITKKTTRPV